MSPNEHARSYADAARLLEAVGDALEQACRSAIRARGAAWLALAGGRTPLPVYARLARTAFDGRIDALPTDERCVPHDHPACNLRQLRTAFGDSPAMRLHPITRADGDVAASLALAQATLAERPGDFDAVLLGMGADGHIASLFPGAANLAQGMAPGSGIDALATVPDPLPPEAPFARISLTLPRLLRAREIHLVVTGEEKRAVLQRVLREPQGGLPVCGLLQAPSPPPIHIHWSP